MSVAERVGEYADGVDAADVLTSVGLAALPGVGLYLVASYAAGRPLTWLIGLGVLGFAAALLPKDGWRSRTCASLTYLAAEAFLVPFAVLFVAVGTISETPEAFGPLGPGFGAAVAVMMSWLASWSLGVLLYYVSRWLES